jgi:DNA replication protein DnaC
MKHEDLVDLLVEKLRWLRLPGMAKLVPSLLDKAAKENLSALDVVHRLCDEEKQSRMRSAVERRIRDASFPEINTVDAFNFDFDPARKKMRARYLALHDLGFLADGINPLFIGAPGTGKTFLARALAYQACQATKRVVCISAPRMLNHLHGAEIHGALERTLRRVNGQQELTHYGHEELTHRGSARWVTIMRVFPPLARNVSRGRGLGHRDRG